ncbi:MAG: hypothetical protein CMP11_07060, partial [Zetaproteobacteria bacterium]|nr:hypothetical protein [Pseudobdellovibrionaceae bacterium]
GIDLGTTNSSVYYIDLLEKSGQPQFFKLKQWERPGETCEKSTLPSFCYLPSKGSFKKGQFNLDFYNCDEKSPVSYVVGSCARQQQEFFPERVIHSAKSWLCHKGIDPSAPVLPWDSDILIGSEKLSPVEVTSYFIRHIKDQWNFQFASSVSDYCLEKQVLVITVPASFDEVSSQLTLDAAKLAGLDPTKIYLLEEPQAALYSWIYENHIKEECNNSCRKLIDKALVKKKSPLNIIVCDIGGGTSDFTLMEMTSCHKSSYGYSITRKKVSEHLLLGGDNIDLKIASMIEQQHQNLSGKHFSSRQWIDLLSKCRSIKEKIFSDLSIEDDSQVLTRKYHLSLSTKEGGSGFFEKVLSFSLSGKDLLGSVLEGFFPECEKNQRAHKNKTGLKEWGLPYAFDGAITRHLSEFIGLNHVDGILFAGGTLIPNLLQNRIVKIIQNWQKSKPLVLNSCDLNLMVAKGASLFAANLVQKDDLWIKGGYPRNLYLEFTQQNKKHQESSSLLCIVSKGYSSYEPIDIKNLNFKLLLNQKVSFAVFYSNTRENDLPGDVISYTSEDIKPLSFLNATMEAKEKETKFCHINLQSLLTPNGLLQIFCIDSNSLDLNKKPNKWQLSFNVQDTAPRKKQLANVNPSSELLENQISETLQQIKEVFLSKKDKSFSDTSSQKLILNMEKTLSSEKSEWDIKLLRYLWQNSLFGLKTKRTKSAKHEAFWLNLSGYFLRPGFGGRDDSNYVQSLWEIFLQGMLNPNDGFVKNQWWIFWRRVSGGLTKRQQEVIYNKIYPSIRKGDATPEMIMAISSLELIDVKKKIVLAKQILNQVLGSSRLYLEQKFWALTRLSSRTPLYSGPENIVPPKIVEEWFDLLEKVGWQKFDKISSYLVRFYLSSTRLINERSLDISSQRREQVIKLLLEKGVDKNKLKTLKECLPIDLKDQSTLFGESLPGGLVLEDE